MSLSEVKALTFDVFGTVVDWRGSLIKQGEQLGKAKNIDVDWAAFADRWRGGYGPSMDRVRRGELPWTNIDTLHRMILDELLEEFGITCLNEEEKQHWNKAWHRLTPWPDSVSGLGRLKNGFHHRHAIQRQCGPAHHMAKSAGCRGTASCQLSW